MDGNFLIKNNVNECVDRYLTDVNMAIFDHMKCNLDPRGCVYQ